MPDWTFTYTDGLIGGDTIQFAEMRSVVDVGPGIAIPEDCFDIVEPHLREAAPEWRFEHRYGIFELMPSARAELANRLRAAAVSLPPDDAKALLFKTLAEWLNDRLDVTKSVIILGV